MGSAGQQRRGRPARYLTRLARRPGRALEYQAGHIASLVQWRACASSRDLQCAHASEPGSRLANIRPRRPHAPRTDRGCVFWFVCGTIPLVSAGEIRRQTRIYSRPPHGPRPESLRDGKHLGMPPSPVRRARRAVQRGPGRPRMGTRLSKGVATWSRRSVTDRVIRSSRPDDE